MATKLQERREARGLRRERVAADANITASYLRLLEKGLHVPSLTVARGLAAALTTTVDDLFPVAADMVDHGEVA